MDRDKRKESGQTQEAGAVVTVVTVSAILAIQIKLRGLITGKFHELFQRVKC